MENLKNKSSKRLKKGDSIVQKEKYYYNKKIAIVNLKILPLEKGLRVKELTE